MPATNRMKFCPFCGTEIIENAKFCMECGSKLPILNQENIEKDKTFNNNSKTTNNITENNITENNITENNITENNITENKFNVDNENTPQKIKDKPRKNFDLLNKQKSKKNNSNNDKVMKNFEITRPSPKLTVLKNPQFLTTLIKR